MLVDARKHFNLSHSGKYVVLAIADQEVGIDIERVRPYHEATAKKIFSNEIQNAMSELCGEEKDRIFTQLWTELEAKLKVKGIGFSKEWENEKVKEYFIETRCIDEYYVSLATEEKISVEIDFQNIFFISNIFFIFFLVFPHLHKHRCIHFSICIHLS